MSEPTAWGWSREQKTGDIVIYDNADDDDHSDVILADGAYLSEEDAATIVRDHNAHAKLVEALEATRHSLIDMDESAYGPQLEYEIGVITAALEAVGSRNGEAKR